jgi:DNA-binding response OmpR family regulator
VVEDDQALREAVEELLSLHGHQVRAVSSGEAALEAIEAGLPELVVSDVIMGGMTGLQLLEAVRASHNSSIPFLFISASISLEEEGHIATLDDVAFLRKPFDIDMLIKIIAAVLNGPSGKANKR